MLSEDYKVDLLEKLPLYHRGIYEYQQIAKAQEPELEAILKAIDFVLDNFFIETATEYGISRLEKMARVTPVEGDTLDTRRFNLLAKWNSNIPYTEQALNQLLSALCGEDGYKLIIDGANYTLTVKLALYNESNIEAVRELLEKVVPANMVINITLYNSYGTLTSFTHEQLAQYTHTELREEIL